MSRRAVYLPVLAIAVALAATLVLDPSAYAQRRGAAPTVAETAGPFGALRWRSVGPERGGRSIAVAGSAERPLEYYFGAAGGGLWKTTD
ncbi:MAG: hypothetical protein ACRD1V_00820, partial [Vicinamibacterales bacterium]